MSSVDKALIQPPAGLPVPKGQPVEVEVSEEASDTTGGVVIQFGQAEEKPVAVSTKHDDNLADFMEETPLRVLGSELLRLFEADRLSRKDWERTYTNGLKLLGTQIEEPTTPWKGACGAYHPILMEAAVRFQAQAMTEIFPASGPCRTKILGRSTPEREAQGKRIEEDMNLLVQEKMPDYRSETDRLLFGLAISGSAFRKIYFDEANRRPAAIYLPAEDVVVSYGTSTIDASERFTVIMRKTSAEMRRLQVSGFYRGIELMNPTHQADPVKDAVDDISGQMPPLTCEDRHIVLEMFIDLDIKEYPHPSGLFVPYVVTIEYSSGQILSIRRNWLEKDPDCKRRSHIVDYSYIPGIGYYGFGLVHLLGNTAKAATALLRQLVDAGQLSNLPGGLRARGLRIKNEKDPIEPGEWRDADAPGDDIRKSLMPLPYKEPSVVLMNLMNQMVEEGRRLASVADINVSGLKQEAPVGTTLALIERSMKVMSGIQARLHDSMGREFKILAGLNAQHYPEYDLDFGIDPKIKQQDYDSRIDVIPVSDPNAASMSQRIMAYTAAQQLSTQAPQIYDLPELHRQILSVLGVKDPEKVIPSTGDIQPKDPVTENQDIIAGRPVKVFPEQDHDAHIRVHMAAIQDPKIIAMIGQSPSAQVIQSAAESHLREHIGFQYRADIEKQMGVELPPYGQPLPPEIEKDYAAAVAKAAEKLLAKDTAEEAAKQAAEKLQDPIVQMQQRELDQKDRDLDRRDRELDARIQEKAVAMIQRALSDAQRNAVEREGDIRYSATELAKAAIQAASQQEGVNAQAANQASELGVRFAERVMQIAAANRKSEKGTGGSGKEAGDSSS